MNLLITYFVTVAVAVSTAAWLGVVIERMASPFISLLVFFTLLVLAIWLSWRFAVKFTAPKTTPSA